MTDGASELLAAERTLLAWIRTGVALMGLGFVVARFGIFVQELAVGKTNPQVRPHGLSFPFGTVLIALGVAVNVISAWNHCVSIGS